MPRKWGEVEFPRCMDIAVLVELTQGPETEVTIKITSNLLILEMETLNLREVTSPIFCSFDEKLGLLTCS